MKLQQQKQLFPQDIFSLQTSSNESTKPIVTTPVNPTSIQSHKTIQISIEQNFFSLRQYFDVSNRYILNKCKLVLFPFQNNWDRYINKDGEALPPKQDGLAPDLYIPFMAFIIFILLKAIQEGLEQNFSPEQLGIRFSTVLLSSCLELIVSYVAFYLSGIHVPVFDILSSISYKFLNLCFIQFFTIVGGKVLFYPAWMFQSCCLFMFLFRTFQSQHKFTLQGQQLQQTELNKSGYGAALLAICIMELCVLSYYCFGV